MAHIGPQILDNLFKGMDSALSASATKGFVDILESSDNIADDIAKWQDDVLDSGLSTMKRAELENLFKSPSFVSRIEALPHIQDFYKSFDDAFETSTGTIDIDGMLAKLDTNTSISSSEIDAIKAGATQRVEARATRIADYMDEQQNAGRTVSYEDALLRDQAIWKRAEENVNARSAGNDAGATTGRGSSDAGKASGSSNSDEAEKVSMLSRPVTWKGMLTTKAALGTAGFASVIGLKVYEHESGGAILNAAVEGVTSGIRELAEMGVITPDNLESYVDKGTYILSVLNAWDKSAQSQYVEAMMGGEDNDDDLTQEQIERGKLAAASWLLKPDNAAILFVKHSVRKGVIDEVFDDKDEADKHLAQELVNDIITGAQVTALGDNQVSEEDVKKAFINAMEEGGLKASVISNERVQNGLHQMWPDEFPDPAAAEVADVEVDTGVEPQSLFSMGGLAAASDGLANRDIAGLTPAEVARQRRGGMSLTDQANALNFGGVSLDSLSDNADEWSNDAVSKVFNAGVEHLGMNPIKQAIFSVVSSIVVGVASMFGESAKVAAQRWVLDEFGVDDKVASLRDNVESNSAVSQFSDRFGIGQRGLDPELSM